MKTIVLTGGGTAGHVFGCLALVPHLRPYFNKIYYLGSKDGIEQKLVSQQESISFVPIETTKLVRSLSPKNLLIPLKLLKAAHQCKKVLKEIQPSIIFSKGGYVSVPVCLAAHKLKIPIILHESDLSLGLANRIIKNKTKAICTSFEETANKLKNGIFCGSPTRQELLTPDLTFKKSLNNPQNKPILLVLGGSLGAQSLNELIWSSLDFLCENFFVVHLTGKGKSKNINHKNYKQIEFCEHMQKLYSIADFAITRGGSNTLFELLTLKIPMIISPLKKQTRGEQTLNALYFCKKGYAAMLENETFEQIKSKIKYVTENQNKMKNNMDKYAKMNTNNIITKFIVRFSK